MLSELELHIVEFLRFCFELFRLSEVCSLLVGQVMSLCYFPVFCTASGDPDALLTDPSDENESLSVAACFFVLTMSSYCELSQCDFSLPCFNNVVLLLTTCKWHL